VYVYFGILWSVEKLALGLIFVLQIFLDHVFVDYILSFQSVGLILDISNLDLFIEDIRPHLGIFSHLVLLYLFIDNAKVLSCLKRIDSPPELIALSNVVRILHFVFFGVVGTLLIPHVLQSFLLVQ
jgi:hypothetical protein